MRTCSRHLNMTRTGYCHFRQFPAHTSKLRLPEYPCPNFYLKKKKKINFTHILFTLYDVVDFYQKFLFYEVIFFFIFVLCCQIFYINNHHNIFKMSSLSVFSREFIRRSLSEHFLLRMDIFS